MGRQTGIRQNMYVICPESDVFTLTSLTFFPIHRRFTIQILGQHHRPTLFDRHDGHMPRLALCAHHRDLRHAEALDHPAIRHQVPRDAFDRETRFL